MPSSYSVYNAAIHNGWDVRETAFQFGIPAADVKRLVVAAGGIVTSRGRIR